MKHNKKENIKNLLQLPLKDKEIILSFKKDLKDKINDVAEIKLFGSYARGTQKSDSDVDILLVLNKVDNKKKDIIVDIVRDIMQQKSKYFSTHIYSLSEYRLLQKMQTPLMKSIKSEAINL